MKKLILVLLGAAMLQLQFIAQARTFTFQFAEDSASDIQNAAEMKDKNSSDTLSDAREREVILKFIEEVRGYYMSKDIDALKTLFSDAGLIVVNGNMYAVKTGRSIPNNNRGYLDYLNTLFKKSRLVEVDFDSISIVRHDLKPQFYGVTLHQSFKNNSPYNYDGWLFMLWDFTNQDRPFIHFRRWQSDEEVEKNGVMDLSDFDL